MKVLFLISTIKSKSGGQGGHYNSLMETCKQLSSSFEIVIVNIGQKKSKRIFSNKDHYSKYHVPINTFKTRKVKKEIQKIIDREKPNIIHSFDRIAFYWGRVLSHHNKLKSVLTKCGGSNHGYYPFSNTLVLFSQENLLYLKQKEKYSNTHFVLIPNRISLFENDETRIQLLRERLPKCFDQNTFTFLRITRIGAYYYESTQMLLETVKDLNNRGLNCNCLVIGTIESEEIFKKLSSEHDDRICFITDDLFTTNAKELIDIADCVLGSGRSLMEASSKGKMLLVPSRDGLFLLSKENFKLAFDFNFSERIQLPSYNYGDELDKISQAIENKALRNEYKLFSEQIFHEHFDSSKISGLYRDLYESKAKIEPRSILDELKHYLLIVKNLRHEF